MKCETCETEIKNQFDTKTGFILVWDNQSFAEAINSYAEGDCHPTLESAIKDAERNQPNLRNYSVMNLKGILVYRSNKEVKWVT